MSSESKILDGTDEIDKEFFDYMSDYLPIKEKMDNDPNFIENIKIHHPFDKIFKILFDNNPNGFSSAFNLDFQMKEQLPTELIDEIYNQLFADRIVESIENVIFLLEFQSSKLTVDDYRRFASYVSLIHKKTKKEVRLFVISMVDEGGTFDYECGDLRLTIHVKSLNSFNSEKVLNTIRFKIENKEELNEEDIVLLALLPLMEIGIKRTNLLWDTVSLTNKIQNLSNLKMVEIKIIQAILGHQFLSYGEFRKYMEVIKMEDYGTIGKLLAQKHYLDCQEAESKGMAKGRVEGMEETIRKDASFTVPRLLDKGFSIEEILEVVPYDIDVLEDLNLI